MSDNVLHFYEIKTILEPTFYSRSGYSASHSDKGGGTRYRWPVWIRSEDRDTGYISRGVVQIMTSKRSALIVVNMTNEFLFSEYGKEVVLERAQKMIPAIRALQEEFISRGLPVIFVNDSHLATDYEIKDWGPHSMGAAEGTRIAEGLLKDNVFVLGREWKEWDLDRIGGNKLMFEVKKGTYSGFTDSGGQPTALHSLLKKLGIEAGGNLYITGLHTNGGVKHTAADAYFRGYHPVIVSDCTDSFNDRDGILGMDHSQALEYAKFWYRAGIMLSGEVTESLEAPEGIAISK